MSTVTERELHFPVHAIYDDTGAFVAAFPTAEAATRYRAILTPEQEFAVLLQGAADAAYGYSNDTEIELLRDSLDWALDLLGIAMPQGNDPDDTEEN